MPVILYCFYALSEFKTILCNWHNCMWSQRTEERIMLAKNLRCSLFHVYQKRSYRSPSRIPVEYILVSVFYSLIFPIFWRRKKKHISFSYMSLLTKLEYKMVRETERKKNVLKSHMFKNLLSRDGGTRINILVKPPNVVAHQKFSKAFRVSWYAFLHTVWKKLSSWLENYLLGIDFRIAVYSAELPNPKSEFGMNSLEYQIRQSFQSWLRELVL